MSSISGGRLWDTRSFSLNLRIQNVHPTLLVLMPSCTSDFALISCSATNGRFMYTRKLGVSFQARKTTMSYYSVA